MAAFNNPVIRDPHIWHYVRRTRDEQPVSPCTGAWQKLGVYAVQVARLKAAGAVILGKGNMGEWAFSPVLSISSVAGIVRNPYDLDRTPAGSSGGPAAGRDYDQSPQSTTQRVLRVQGRSLVDIVHHPYFFYRSPTRTLNGLFFGTIYLLLAHPQLMHTALPCSYVSSGYFPRLVTVLRNA